MKEYAIPISITLLILIAGGVYYFQTIVPEQNLIKNSGDLYNDAKFKVAFSPEGNMKIFVNAKNNELAKLKISEGSSIPESTSIVMGAAEAQMMQEEKLFTNIGDEIKGLFGVDVKIGGILKQRGDFTDDVHFISDTQFTQLLGDESRISTKVAPDGALKVFYVYNNEELPKLKLKEGNVENYKITTINGKEYTPVIIGSSEAAMMREEKLFGNTGDTIDNLFGKDIVIVGVLEKTNSAIDMMHFIPN